MVLSFVRKGLSPDGTHFRDSPGAAMSLPDARILLVPVVVPPFLGRAELATASSLLSWVVHPAVFSEALDPSFPA